MLCPSWICFANRCWHNRNWHSVTRSFLRVTFGCQWVNGVRSLFVSALRCQITDSPHDYAIIWKHFPLYWPFVWGLHRSTMNSPHKGQWRVFWSSEGRGRVGTYFDINAARYCGAWPFNALQAKSRFLQLPPFRYNQLCIIPDHRDISLPFQLNIDWNCWIIIGEIEWSPTLIDISDILLNSSRFVMIWNSILSSFNFKKLTFMHIRMSVAQGSIRDIASYLDVTSDGSSAL